MVENTHPDENFEMTEKFDIQIIQKIDCIQSRLERLDKENQDYDKLIFEKIQQISILEQEIEDIRKKVDGNSTQRKILEEQLQAYNEVLDKQIEDRLNFHRNAILNLERKKEELKTSRRFKPY